MRFGQSLLSENFYLLFKSTDRRGLRNGAAPFTLRRTDHYRARSSGVDEHRRRLLLLLVHHFRVDLGRADFLVSEKLLNRVDVRLRRSSIITAKVCRPL